MRSASRERPHSRLHLGSLLLAGMLLAPGGLSFAAEKMRQEVLLPLVDLTSRTLARVKAADIAGALTIFKTFEDLWAPVED